MSIDTLVQIWHNEFERAKGGIKMSLLYLAHDVILRDRTGQYGEAFRQVRL